MSASHYIRKHASAFALVLLFLGGWLAVPVALAMPEPITCGMECCEESGECCCFISRQAHNHKEGDSEEEASVLALRKTCPPNCSTPLTVRNVTQQIKPLASLLWCDGEAQDEPLVRQALYPLRLEPDHPSAPRAPPVIVRIQLPKTQSEMRLP